MFDEPRVGERQEHQHDHEQAQQHEQRPLGPAVVDAGGSVVRTAPRRGDGGGGGGGGGPCELMRPCYGDRATVRPRGAADRAPWSTSRPRAADRVAGMQRRCARPSCNESASTTLAYDYANRTVWLDHLADEAHPMTHDLCAAPRRHAVGAAGLDPAGPPHLGHPAVLRLDPPARQLSRAPGPTSAPPRSRGML